MIKKQNLKKSLYLTRQLAFMVMGVDEELYHEVAVFLLHLIQKANEFGLSEAEVKVSCLQDNSEIASLGEFNLKNKGESNEKN